jgi:hypothetical protein
VRQRFPGLLSFSDDFFPNDPKQEDKAIIDIPEQAFVQRIEPFGMLISQKQDGANPENVIEKQDDTSRRDIPELFSPGSRIENHQRQENIQLLDARASPNDAQDNVPVVKPETGILGKQIVRIGKQAGETVNGLCRKFGYFVELRRTVHPENSNLLGV